MENTLAILYIPFAVAWVVGVRRVLYRRRAGGVSGEYLILPPEV